jgi:predicted HTH transcriptional regulator
LFEEINGIITFIKIFDNRIEFYNLGKLYDGITVQDLLSGNYVSKSRNKLIAKAFKEVGIIERYGSGIVRVRKICREYGVKEPDFNEIAGGFQVILYNEKIAFGEKVGEKLTENQQIILNYIVENPHITAYENNDFTKH